ncbi:ankyrin repeat-containing domain protein [Nemania sp. FL0031]|nr:ankyrin repeat-containing domain protein [Nemania sp. FL0031]
MAAARYATPTRPALSIYRRVNLEYQADQSLDLGYRQMGREPRKVLYKIYRIPLFSLQIGEYANRHAIVGYRLDVQSSNSTNVGSRIRSTQNELQRLFQMNYRELRPSSGDEAHERVELFRHVRHGRINKQRSPRVSDISGTNKGPESYNRVFPRLDVPPLMPDISGTYPEVVTIPDGSAALSSTFDDGSDRLRYMVSPKAVDSDQRYEVEGSTPREHVRLSWVRENLRSISGSVCSSRACAEIRSLLSRLSSRASRQSRVDTFISVEDPVLSALQGISTNGDNTNMIRLCCEPSRTRGKTCIHRKVLMAIQGQTIGPELMNDGLDAQCFTAWDGRDIWNQTVLHLAAKWAPDECALALLLQFIDQYPDSTTILNIKNIEGKTFMHIIAERWYDLAPQSATTTLASFCSEVLKAGYVFTLPDSNGRTFFDCFLGVLSNLDIATPWHISQVEGGLRSFLELLSDLEFDEISATLKPIPNIGSGAWFFNDLTTLLRRKGLNEPAYGFGGDRHMSTENEFHLLLRERRLEPNDIRRLYFGLTFTNRPSINELNAYNSEGKTCIMVLIEMVTAEKLDQREDGLLETFLGCGIDLQLVDRDGNTALHYAVRAQLPMVASRLIACGMDVNARNLSGETALTIAAVHLRSISSLREPDETGTRYARANSTFVRLFKSSSRKGQEKKKMERVLEMWGLLQRNDGQDGLGEVEGSALDYRPVVSVMKCSLHDWDG